MKKTYFLFAVLLFPLLTLSQPNDAPLQIANKDIIASRIDSLLTGYAFYGRFSGTVLVAHGDEILFTGSYGYSNYQNQTLNNSSSVYGVGSITKNFTATAVMKLAQQGKLSLDDKLYDFFPGLGDVAHEITIHHLLSMSSGIYEDFSRSKSYDISKVIFPESYPVTISHLVHYFGEITSDATPGKKYDYSNYNYILLAAIIEQVSGMEYEEFLKTMFFGPLGMELTAFGFEQADTALVSNPYIGMPLSHIQPPYWHDSWVKGAGGIFASATDLYTWLYAFNNNLILSGEYAAKMITPHTKTSNQHYGYGWQIGSRKKQPYRWHEGGTLGYVCEAGYFPAQDLYVVVLTNHTHELMEIGKTVLLNHEINAQIHNVVFDQPFTVLPLPKSAEPVTFTPSFSVNGYTFNTQTNGHDLSISSLGHTQSLLDVAYEQDLTSDSRRFRKAARVANAIGHDDFGYVWRKGELMFKVLVSSSKLQNMYQELTGDKGEFKSMNFYQLPKTPSSGTYRVRLVHENKQIGLRLVFNTRGRLAGMHIDQQFSYNGPQQIQAFIIDHENIFIDGFRYGYSDARMVKKDGKWMLEMLGQILPVAL